MEDCIGRRDGACRQIVVTGFHGLWRAFEDPELHRALNSADLWVPDGIAPVWVARLKGFRGAQRLPGAELMEAFFARADQKGFSSFFYGDSVETLDALAQRLESRHPGHRIAGTFSPPFRELSEDEERQHVEMINAARPDVLWLGLGMPKQDLWIYRNRHRLHVPVAVGVGAGFRFIAGTVGRAPGWVGRMGLEWLWRLAQEPRKCWRRCFVEGPQFVWHVGLELAKTNGDGRRFTDRGAAVYDGRDRERRGGLGRG